jgi:diguanylate cyclase (GGDEF)-like protein
LETELRDSGQANIPVEVIFHSVSYGTRPHYAVAVRDLRARHRAEGQIRYLAHHDPLTGLANRASFHRHLDQEMKRAKSTGAKLAILCLDLDRFKDVNDCFGHAAGDSMLVNVARLVTSALDEGHQLARLGGDEFAIIAECDHAVSAGLLAERVLEELRRDNADGAGPLIAMSIGITIFPDDAVERDLLLSYADTALYRAKAEGRGTYRFFEQKMGAQVRERRQMEHDLRHAISRHEMRIVFQPQTKVSTGEVVGFEALLRWQHPERGSVSPAVFIPVAEESGSIPQIGEWVLRETCREAASWPQPLCVGRERLGHPDPQPEFRSDRARHPVRDRAEAGAARDRDHRDRAHPRPEPCANDPAPAESPRCPDRHGRFRNRLFLALEPARVSVRQDQDRPLLHSLGRYERADGRHRSFGPRPRSAGSASRCWQRGWKRMAS